MMLESGKNQSERHPRNAGQHIGLKGGGNVQSNHFCGVLGRRSQGWNCAAIPLARGSTISDVQDIPRFSSQFSAHAQHSDRYSGNSISITKMTISIIISVTE
jgi:hypothetical protein